jgi:hypothetical protein
MWRYGTTAGEMEEKKKQQKARNAEKPKKRVNVATT